MTYYAAANQVAKKPLEGGIEISKEQYLEGINALTTGKTISVVNGFEIIDPAATPVRELEEVRREALVQIDSDAEAARKVVLTPGEGQAMEYLQSAAEAKELLVNLEGDPEFTPLEGQYPMLEASLGIDGETLQEVAVSIFGMHSQWLTVGASIRQKRLAAKKVVAEASSIEAIDEAVQINWFE